MKKSTSSPPKKVLIMTVGLGGGHKAMGRNLEEVLSEADPTLAIKTLDVIHDAWPAFSDRSAQVYAGSTSRAGAFWYRVYYALTDRFPWLLLGLGRLLFMKYAKDAYAREKPDLIIATFPLLADVAAMARDHHGGTTPIIVTVTDAGRVQGIWLSKRADLTLTATPDTVNYLVSRGLDRAKVRFIGFPAAKQFYDPVSKTTARERLGLETDTFTILLTAGGAGLNHKKIIAVAEAIGRIELPYQIVLNAGSNDELREAFAELEFPHATQVIVKGFTDQMIDYMTASDVICSKSGWLTVNEALVLQRPLILYDVVPGQEEQNVDYVVGNHFGMYAPYPAQVVAELERLISTPRAFDEYQQSMKRAKTDANPYAKLSKAILRYLPK